MIFFAPWVVDNIQNNPWKQKSIKLPEAIGKFKKQSSSTNFTMTTIKDLDVTLINSKYTQGSLYFMDNKTVSIYQTCRKTSSI